MDQVMEKPAHHGRPFYFKNLEREAQDHAENGNLIPGEEHFPEIERPLHAGCIGGIFPIIILGQRESTGNHEHILGHGKELDVGKSFFSVNNVGTDAPDGPDVGQHGTHDESSLVPLIREDGRKEMGSHETGDQAHEHGEKGDHDKGPADGKDPETHDVQYGHHDKYIEQDDPVTSFVIDDACLLQDITQRQGPEDIDDDQESHVFTSHKVYIHDTAF